jgi:P pilus assembly chaperone PapD
MLSPRATAQGDLMIMPKRLVFEGSQRSQEINLANTGQDTAVYAISFINYKMTTDGKFEQIETPEEGQRFATDFLRYFPRRVTLAPNEAQTIRVQLTRSGNLEQGEYRSHMYFRAVEKQGALGVEEDDLSEGIAIQIRTIFGISIPVIIRHGETNVKVSLSNVQVTIEDDSPKLLLEINRKGNFSTYGDLLVEHISLNGEKTEVGLVKGISVYTPNLSRHFSMNLAQPEDLSYTEGKLRITYKKDETGTLATYEHKL